MKKLVNLLLIVVLSFSLLFSACKPSVANVDTVENKVVIVVNGNVEDNVSLLSFMATLKNENLLDYKYQSGQYGAYITAINGVQASLNQGWMLYSDDGDFTANNYQIELNGKIYSQTVVGCENLIVKKGMTYIWVLEDFSYGV